MLINPNLYPGDYYFSKDCINYRNNPNFKRIGDSVFVDSTEDTKPLLRTIFEKIGYVRGDKIMISAFIVNVGEVPININAQGVYNETVVVDTLEPNEVKKFKRSFKSSYDGNLFGFSTDYVGRMGVRCLGIKYELGETSTLYLPYVNSLEPSKQAIYLAGGGIPRGVSTLAREGVLYAS